MAKTNYAFEKRQRDLAAKKKREEKLARKAEKKAEKDAGNGEGGPPIDWNKDQGDTGGES